jgi:hypothetical protein
MAEVDRPAMMAVRALRSLSMMSIYFRNVLTVLDSHLDAEFRLLHRTGANAC